MEGTLISIVVLAVGVFAIVLIVKRSKATIIKSPTIAFLDLSRGEFAEQLLEDKGALGSLLESASESSPTLPQCNVLFLNCHCGPQGSIVIGPT